MSVQVPAMQAPDGRNGQFTTSRPVAVRLELLGRLSLTIEGRSIPVFDSAQRVFAFAALKGRQRRGYIAGVLWPDIPDEQALTRLRTALWRIRRISEVLIDGDEHEIGLAEHVSVDVQELMQDARRILEGGGVGPGSPIDHASIIKARPLLLGWYDDWIIGERERLDQLRLHALERLVDDLLVAGRHSEALEAAFEAVTLDPLRESTHRAVIRVYLAEGNPGSARRQFDRYRELLRSEFGVVQPTPLILDLLGPLVQTPISAQRRRERL